jgi:hypothetical protein
MKKSRFVSLLLAAAIMGITGCDAASTETQTTTTPPPMGAVSERSGDDAYAIDKINVEPLPENAFYMSKFLRGIIIIGDTWECDINGENYKEQFQSLDKYAETCMSGLVMNYKLETSDLDWEEPVHTTIAGYDAVLYDYVIQETAWVTGSDGMAVTDAEGSGSSYDGRHFTGKAYFFFSDTDAYYIIFQCKTPDYEKSLPQWNEILANVKVDEDLKLPDVTTFSASYVVTDY